MAHPTATPAATPAWSHLTPASVQCGHGYSCLKISKPPEVFNMFGEFDLGQEVQKLHLNRFMLKLKNSGYNEKFRTEYSVLENGMLMKEKS